MGARVDFPTDDMPVEGMGEELIYEPLARRSQLIRLGFYKFILVKFIV